MLDGIKRNPMEREELRRIMILDENVLDVLRAKKVLVKAGYEVVKLASPNGADAKLEYENPDILLLDVGMSRLNLQSFLAFVHATPKFEDLIIVLFSNLDAEMLQKFCVDNDIHGYFCKSMGIGKVAEFLDHFYEEF
jgi:PleD family two-component response regulator